MKCVPEIKMDNGIPTLYVKGQPFFVHGGEIHNSSASSLEYMEKNVWPNLEDLHMNALIVPLYWEMIEPERGEYRFELLDGLISQARKHGMHLVFLWFGLWKNSESMYVPAWVKQDTEMYFRVEKVNGEKINTISPLCEAAIERDAEAFAKVMAHIKKTDEEENTVIIMQVENEIGVLGTERDYSPAAQKAFVQMIPKELEETFQKKGTWKEVFGEQAEESFMAYWFARAVEKITKAGREEYPIPCYANAWLRQYPWYAGSYPSGGPVKEVHEIWKATAPSLFTLAPDIYVPYVADVIDEYGYEGNPLFIPEVRKDAVTASYCMYAFGKGNAIGYSPFGIEELGMPEDQVVKPPMEVMIALNIDPSAFDISGSKEYLAKTYQLLTEMQPFYLKYRGTSHLKSFVKKSETDFGTYFQFEKYDIAVSYSPKVQRKPVAAGIIYELDTNKFLICGMMSDIRIRLKAGEHGKVDFLKLEEGEFTNGTWKAGRVLNGDERMTLKLGDMPSCLYVEVYQY